jgi:hypothetical protein
VTVPVDLQQLEARFNARVIELLNASREHAPFLAVRNLVPPRQDEALRWVHNVLAAPHASDATWELSSAGYAALTVEWLALEDRWSALFTPEEQAIARSRLGIQSEEPDLVPVRADIEARFHGRMVHLLEVAQRDVRYDAVHVRRLLEEHGGLEAARAVLAQPALAGGLGELAAAGRPDLSIEALILDPSFESLFTAEELATAHERAEREKAAKVDEPGLETQFDRRMWRIYEDARAELHYNATRFLEMLSTRGGLDTAHVLLRSPGVSDGFTELWSRGRSDLTVEALVLESPFDTQFTPEELAIARERLGR